MLVGMLFLCEKIKQFSFDSEFKILTAATYVQYVFRKRGTAATYVQYVGMCKKLISTSSFIFKAIHVDAQFFPASILFASRGLSSFIAHWVFGDVTCV